MALSTTLAVATAPWAALAAWACASSCVALGLRRQRALRRLAPPDSRRLLRELLSDLQPSHESGEQRKIDDRARRMAIAELNQRLHDVSFELGLLPATFTALVRISLAVGSTCALIGFVAGSSEPAVIRTVSFVFAVSGGLLGAASLGAIGRLAKSQGALIREQWDGASRVVGKALGTSMDGPATIRR